MDALLEKMKLNKGVPIAVLGAPAGFVVPELLHATGQPYDEAICNKYKWIAICLLHSAEVGIEVSRALDALAVDGMMWICYPKKSGKIKTDLSRDHGWDSISHLGLRHLNLISIDDDWTAWGVEHGSNEVSAKTRQKSEDRNALLAQYMDHTTREMRYPDEMTAALEKNASARDFLDRQSFSNRKEYVEWIVTAKRPETRQQRLDKMIDYLSAGRKNPSGR